MNSDTSRSTSEESNLAKLRDQYLQNLVSVHSSSSSRSTNIMTILIWIALITFIWALFGLPVLSVIAGVIIFGAICRYA